MRMVCLAAAATALAMTGAAQAQADDPATYSAQIGAGGAAVRGSDVRASAKIATGRYEITFSRDVDDCDFKVSLRGSATGQITAANKAAAPRVVAVNTFSKSGVAIDRPFSITVSCEY